MNESTEINLHEIRRFAEEWFRALDRHEPAEFFAPRLAGNVLQLVVPEDRYEKFTGFKQWYERALHLFFDEQHELTDLQIESNAAATVTVKVVVRWQASTWTPPDARSKRIIMDAYQTWVLRRSAVTGQPEIVEYVVDKVEYAEGSATL